VRFAPLAAAGCALALLAAAPAQAVTHDWTRFGFDAARSSSSTANAGIAAADIKHLKRQDVGVPGTVDSSAIYVHAVTVAGKTRDVLIATTSYGKTFALGANTGHRLWTFKPPTLSTFEGSHQITHSSPIVDRKAGVVYSASPDGLIHKLSLGNGKEVGAGSWPVSITRDPTHEKIGTPLNLAGRFVIATTGGYTGDAPPYQGHVALIDRDTGKLVRVFNSLCSDSGGLLIPATCTESGSAIWGRGGAVVVPGSHRILVATGDGKFNGTTFWGDSVLELSPDAKQLVGNWTPTDQSSLDSGDVDLGSTAPALLPSGSRMFALQGGKDGKLRLLDLSNLNGHGTACNCTGGQLQTVSAPGGGVYTAPAVWRHNGATWAFVANLSGQTAGYRLGGTPARLHRVWTADRSGTSPVIAGGLLYVYSPDGGLTVYRPATGKAVGGLNAAGGHWNTPIVADGRVVIPVGDANAHKTSGTITIYRKP
jgi:outer membrane protein assembly factor BamB